MLSRDAFILKNPDTSLLQAAWMTLITTKRLSKIQQVQVKIPMVPLLLGLEVPHMFRSKETASKSDINRQIITHQEEAFNSSRIMLGSLERTPISKTTTQDPHPKIQATKIKDKKVALVKVTSQLKLLKERAAWEKKLMIWETSTKKKKEASWGTRKSEMLMSLCPKSTSIIPLCTTCILTIKS